MREVTFPMGDAFLRAQNPVSDITSDDITPSPTFARVMNDPATAAPETSGATKASCCDCRMLDGARELETRLADTSNEVRARPGRPVQTGERRRRNGVCPGPLASGESSNYMDPSVRLVFAKLWARFLFPDRWVTPRP